METDKLFKIYGSLFTPLFDIVQTCGALRTLEMYDADELDDIIGSCRLLFDYCSSKIDINSMCDEKR